MKKKISVLLCLVMLVALMPAAFAEPVMTANLDIDTENKTAVFQGSPAYVASCTAGPDVITIEPKSDYVVISVAKGETAVTLTRSSENDAVKFAWPAEGGEYTVTFGRYYGITVGNVKVNELNKDDVLKDGKVAFTPGSENRLDLNAATITNGITVDRNKIGTLLIGNTGNSTISGPEGANAAPAIDASGTGVKIIGTGTLTINGATDDAATNSHPTVDVFSLYVQGQNKNEDLIVNVNKAGNTAENYSTRGIRTATQQAASVTVEKSTLMVDCGSSTGGDAHAIDTLLFVNYGYTNITVGPGKTVYGINTTSFSNGSDTAKDAKTVVNCEVNTNTTAANAIKAPPFDVNCGSIVAYSGSNAFKAFSSAPTVPPTFDCVVFEGVTAETKGEGVSPTAATYIKPYEEIAPFSIRFKDGSEAITMVKGSTRTLEVETIPAGQTVTWECSDTAGTYVTLSTTGVLTANEVTTDPVVVKAKANGLEVQRNVHVTAPVSTITLDKTTATLTLGEKTKIKVATLVPEDTTVTWSKNAGDIYVKLPDTLTGKEIEILAQGCKNNEMATATITATTAEGASATCTINVKPVTSTSVKITTPSTKNWAFTGAGLTGTFKATVSPAYSDENSNIIKWTSSNENVVKLASTEANGTVAHFYSVGSGTATVTAACGTKSDTMSVTVASDYKFTSPTGKLIFYYDSASKNDCTFTTNIPAAGVRKVVVNGYDLTSYCSVSSSTGTITIPYSTLYGTFGRQTATMTLKVYYTDSSYIEKPLYYRSIYDSPLTADGDMTWAYITMLFSGIAIASSTFVLRKIKRSH